MRDRAIAMHDRSAYDGETLAQRNLYQRKRAMLDIEHLRRKFVYVAETGKIFRRLGDDKYFELGREAFKSISGKGYLGGSFNRQKFLSHRVAWALFYGEWPHGQIDHLNGNRKDNRINNLRVVSNLENCRNLGRRSVQNPDRDSGVNGVYWHKKNQKWVARLKTNGVWIYLGSHTDLEQAVAARRRAEAAYGFHPNHGRRAATTLSHLS